MRFKDKVVLITGAARGMGRSHAIRFAKEGATVIINDICTNDPVVPYNLATKEELDDTLKLVRGEGSNGMAIIADVSNEKQVKEMINKVIKEFDGIDIVVNNAGIVTGWHQIIDMEKDVWQRAIDVMLTGTFLVTKYSLPSMIKRGWGRVINISSTGGIIGFEGTANYVAAKHGIIGFTKSLALEVAKYNITANAICPGRTATVMTLDMIKKSKEFDETGDSMLVFPNRGMMEPSDVSGLVLWLASEEARYVTGACIPIDSGYTAK